MKIAVTYENGEIFQHFGHTSQFKIYEVENNNIVKSEISDTNGSGHHHGEGHSCGNNCSSHSCH